jgi:ferrous-iron efflux pump FieF
MDRPKPPRKEIRLETTRESVAVMGLKTRLVAVILTLVYAVTANSLALWSDLASTLIGFLALFAAWLTLRAVRVSSKETFSFGLTRLESVSSLGISALMLLSFLLITGTAVWKFLNPSPASGFGIYMGLIVNAVYACINVWIWWRTSLLERQGESPLMIAQRRLYTFQALSNMLMVLAMSLILLFANQHWTFYIDPVVSVILAVTLVLSATKTLHASALNLIDRALEERSQLLILRALAEHFEDYVTLHGIRTRNSGGRSFVELFLEFDPTRSHGEIQEKINNLQRRLETLLERADVVIMPTLGPPSALS